MTEPYRTDDGTIVVPAWTGFMDELTLRPGDEAYESWASTVDHIEAAKSAPPAPPCPLCRSRNTARVTWGLLDDPRRIAPGEIIGGCCVPSSEGMDYPPFGCEDCGAVFDDAGHVVADGLGTRRSDV